MIGFGCVKEQARRWELGSLTLTNPFQGRKAKRRKKTGSTSHSTRFDAECFATLWSVIHSPFSVSASKGGGPQTDSLLFSGHDGSRAALACSHPFFKLGSSHSTCYSFFLNRMQTQFFFFCLLFFSSANHAHSCVCCC